MAHTNFDRKDILARPTQIKYKYKFAKIIKIYIKKIMRSLYLTGIVISYYKHVGPQNGSN